MTRPNVQSEADALKRALFAVRDLRGKLEALEQAHNEPIAIIGMGCRLPGGADDPEKFWRLLRNGFDAVKQVPADRWSIDDYYDPNPDAAGKMYTRSAGFLDRVDLFDSQFFGIAPREAASMDPQHRLLVEVCWEALEHGGQAPDKLAGSQTGVFVGITTNDYLDTQVSNATDLTYAIPGNLINFAAGRISYLLGTEGPCMAVDAACASSLVSVHLACQSLRNRECEMALACGVNVILSPQGMVLLSRMRALSADGRCKTFDASADGMGRGEGCGVVVLKRLSDALVAKDNVLAVIRGSAVSQDGKSSGLTVPNPFAQARLIRSVLEQAKVQPKEVDYIEAHGTGTPLGDPIEMEGLASVFASDRVPTHPLVIGSVKTNIGHLESAAGIAGLIKVVLALQHEQIPSHLHFNHPSAKIDWSRLPCVIPKQPLPWPKMTRKRIAGISAFGLSGILSHVLVEEAPRSNAVSQPDRSSHLLTISTKDESALQRLVASYDTGLAASGASAIADIAYTANAGRSHFTHRLAIVVKDVRELQGEIAAWRAGEKRGNVYQGEVSRFPRIAFLFSGQGSQYAGMGRTLYATAPVFRAALDRCAALLLPLLEVPLLDVMFGSSGSSDLLDQTAYTQPALFALAVALTELWRSWGVEPAAVLGHSIGEYAAAWASGALDLEEGLRLVAVRGRLMQSLPVGGEMAAVIADEATVADAIRHLHGNVSIAAINGPHNVVISGSGDAVSAVVRELSLRGFQAAPLVVSHAFHSPLMAPILDQFEYAASQICFRQPEKLLVSNLTGERISGEQLSTPNYWSRQIRQPVQFQKGMQVLAKEGCDIFVEIGPSPVLVGMGRKCVDAPDADWIPSLRRGRDDWQQMLESLAQLYVRGVQVDWDAFDLPYTRRKLALPTYPFNRQRHWVGSASSDNRSDRPRRSNNPGEHPFLKRRFSSPAIRGTVFEGKISTEASSFLAHHQVFGTIVLPATAYLDMAFSVAAKENQTAAYLKNVVIAEAMIVPEREDRVLQLILEPPHGLQSSFKIVSSTGLSDATWTTHATGEIAFDDRSEKGLEKFSWSDLFDRVRRDCTPSSGEALYSTLQERGLAYGPSFKNVSKMWSGPREALGLVECDQLSSPGKHFVHPGVLDSCLHVIAGIGEAAGAEGVYIPIGFEHVSLFEFTDPRVWCHAAIDAQTSPDNLVANIQLFDLEGQQKGFIQGIQLKRISPASLSGIPTSRLNRHTYTIEWRQDKRSLRERNGRRGRWLIAADRSGIGDALAQRIMENGDQCTIVYSESLHSLGRSTELEKALTSDICGVVHLWSLDRSTEKDRTLDRHRDSELGFGSALRLVQTVVRQAPSARVWLVTRGAQPVRVEDALYPDAAPLCGFARVVANEHPELRCSYLDLDSSDSDSEALFDIISNDTAETEIAIRGNARFVPRLKSYAVSNRQSDVSPYESVSLKHSHRGVLHDLSLHSTPRRQARSGELEILVRAAGLNFRDVLTVLGQYPGPPAPLGSEFSGEVVAVGPDVYDFRVGDQVVGLAVSSFSTYVTTSARFVAHKPRCLSFEQAAAVPITFLTAWYGLYHLTQLRAGERVLIHAAAGGVGQAAIQLAKRVGAEIFATAGTDEKREYLRSLGIDHVMSSRSVEFAREILERTNGEGVDVVLNSLTGPFIPKTFSVLRSGGRFIEIGKLDIWETDRIQQSYPGISYQSFALDLILERDPQLITDMLARVIADMDSRALHPMPVRCFPVERAESAFRYMAQAKHIGKIVLSFEQLPVRGASPVFDSNAAYMITGGTGGIGLLLAHWLSEHGARRLLLVARKEPLAGSMESIREIQEKGVEIRYCEADVSKYEDVERLFADLDRSETPLGGVFHAAGTLDDGPLEQQTSDRCDRVLRPKIDGARNLHLLTATRSLDYFVLFSAGATLLGSIGQSAYAAANGYLDSLAHFRRMQGLPALSVNWGPWRNTGMAAVPAENGAARWNAFGVETIDPHEALTMLGRLMQEDVAQVAVMPVRWRDFQNYFPGGMPSLFRDLTDAELRTGDPASRPRDLRKEWARAHAANRSESVLKFVRDEVARVLGSSSGALLKPSQPLNEMGLDSLMAVELRNALTVSVGETLPAGFVFQYPTISAIADYLFEILRSEDSQDSVSSGVMPASEEARLVTEIENLSEDELDVRLNRILEEQWTRNSTG